MFLRVAGSLLILILCVHPWALAEPGTKMKVGVLLPLTGPVAEYGVAAKNGFELAKEEKPELFQNVEFVFEDTKYDGTTTLTAFKKLRSAEGIAIAYVWGYGPNQALAPVAEAEHFPLIAVSAERAVSANKKYVLRFCYYIEMIADRLVEYLRARGMKQIGVVKAEIAYMNGLIGAMKKQLHPGESITIVDSFQPGDSEFKPTLAKLTAKRFDVLGVFLISGQISQFYRDMKKINLHPETFGTDFFDSLKEVKDAGGAMAGAVFAGPYIAPAFVARYVKRYGNDIQAAWAASAYEFAALMGALFDNQPNKLTADEIVSRLRAQNAEQGTATRYQFNESPEGSGFDVQVVTRKVEADSIVDFTAVP